MSDFYAPHIYDPDDPNEGVMTQAQAEKAAKIARVLHPELVDHSMDGPILRGKKRHLMSPHYSALHGFTVAVGLAERHRRILKHHFGYNDRQIGQMAMLHQKRLTRASKRG